MRKKSTYIYTLLAVSLLIVIGFILNIPIIRNNALMIFNFMGNPWVAVTAAVSAFIFMGKKHYWLINGAVAIIASLGIQYLIISHSAGIVTIIGRAVAFLVIVYVLNLIRVIFSK